MNRIIKFRAFNKDAGNKNRWMRVSHPFFNDDGSVSDVSGECLTKFETWFNNFELMQYTGLLDKNGEEIYEGDIICWDGENKKEVIIWNQEMASFTLSRTQIPHPDITEKGLIPLGMLDNKKFEIVGNVFENLNLLTPNTTGGEGKE